MKRIYPFTFAVVLVLLASAGGVLAQGWGTQDAQPQSKNDQVARVAAVADTSFAHFFLIDPTLNDVWWRSHTVVDASGGIHVTFYDSSNIYYAYCATDCSNSANWLEIALFGAGSLDPLDEPTLALDPNGHPRLMWYAEYSGDTNYYYAECNANCADSSSNWTPVAVANMGSYGYPQNVRYFALDTHGRPRFVYPWYGYPDDGLFYIACDAGCTNASNWYTTTVTTPGLEPDVMQLVFDQNDQPRVLGYDSNNTSLVYVECNGDCSVAANWGSVALFDMGYTYYYGYALRLDAQGRPRIAYYRADSSNNVLHYAWSNANALTVTGWLSYTLNYPSNSTEWTVDLALDSQGRPRVTFATDELDLRYVTCTANCESASPTWQQQYIETSDDLNVSYPISNPGCIAPTWMIVGYPSLALDTADNPNVSYFAKHGQLCYDSQGNLRILYDAKGIRFARPGGSSTPTTPGNVTINGPTIGAVGISYTFTATVSPITVTTPITYVWQATGQTAQTHTGRGTSDTATFTWPSGATGIKTITVSATNVAGTISRSSSIAIYAEPIQFDHWVYMPVVIK